MNLRRRTRHRYGPAAEMQPPGTPAPSQEINIPLPSAPKTSFGDRMKREREMRGVKLEEISESTKIARRNLLALEEEHFDQLPGGIFNKGFVRAYARYLGLDEDQAVNDFMAASANYEQPEALRPPESWVKPPVIPSDAATRRKNRRWMLAATLVLVAGCAGWIYFSHPLPLVWPSLSYFRARSAATPPAPGRRPRPAASSAESFPLSAGAAAPSATSAQAAEFSVNVYAWQPAWVSVTADGKLLLDAILDRDTERNFRAQKQLVIKTGNAGGLELSQNGKPLPALGEQKQVRTIIITPQGIQR